jgi:hypothetical protein
MLIYDSSITQYIMLNFNQVLQNILKGKKESKEMKQKLESDSHMAQILELLDTKFKITMFKKLRTLKGKKTICKNM